MIRNSFIDNLFDIPKLDAFINTHKCNCDNYNNYTIVTKGTGIGIYATIQCDDCLKTEDISDYEHW